MPSRREFLRTSALGGAALCLEVPLLGGIGSGSERFAPNPWLRILPDGRVTLVIARSEMGQGVRTSLAMILADELDADWASVSIEQASPGPDYRDLNTGGSDSVASAWRPLRVAAAAAREMLLEAAARTWKVERGSCRAEKGAVLHESSGRRISYGELVAATLRLPVPKEPALKARADFRLLGTHMPRIDGPAIVTGRAVYGLDVRVPAMLFAAVARCPVAGGKAVRFDASRAMAVRGVRRVVEIPGGVAVVAKNSWAAFGGRDALSVTWDEGANATLSSEELWRRIDAAAAVPGRVSRRHGDAAAALAAAPKRLAASYRDAFQAHGSVEPGNCTALVSPGRCEIWAPTQNPQRVQREVGTLLGIAPEKVTVHVTLLGGGFGRRLDADYATEAAAVARAAGGAVQVVWSRADDFLHDRLHPCARVDLEAGIDASGRIVAWRHRATSYHLSMFGKFDPNEVDDPDVSPWGGFDTPYAVENLLVEYKDIESPIHTGAWRAVFYPPNVFARESFVDEVAAAMRRDPLALRLELLAGDPVLELPPWRIDRGRLRAVLELAARNARWGAPLSALPGRRVGRGIACNVYHGRTVLAHVAEVSVGAAGDVRVHRIVTAADCGQVVNRLGVESQVQSGVAWGLSYALKGEITVRGGRVAETSYADYPLLEMAEMPLVEVHMIDSDAAPSGFGEQPVPPVAPAVANAIFAATGRRVRRLPIRPGDLT